MSRVAIKHRVIQKIKDDYFNVDDIGGYNLFIKLYDTRLKICITEESTHKCLFLEDFLISKSLRESERIQLLETIYDEHSFLKAGFWKSVRLVISSKHFTFIPRVLFDDSELESYISLSTRYDSNTEDLAYYSHHNSEAICVFSVNREIIQWFQESYPQVEIKLLHNTSPLIEGALQNTMPVSQKQLYLFADDDQLTGIVTWKEKLEFCNTFTFKNADELLYFTMWIMGEMEMDPAVNEVILFGEITEESDYYQKLYEYILNVSFGNKPGFLKFSYQFDQVNDHRYLDLYCMHLCK